MVTEIGFGVFVLSGAVSIVNPSKTVQKRIWVHYWGRFWVHYWGRIWVHYWGRFWVHYWGRNYVHVLGPLFGPPLGLAGQNFGGRLLAAVLRYLPC